MSFPIQRFTQAATPCYYYDMALLRRTIDSLKAALAPYPHFHVHYAIKANANPRILECLSQAGLGADCVSGGEVEQAVAYGFPADRIVFAGVGKTDDEIRASLKAGISRFNVESLAELEVINELAAEMGVVAPVAFRVNPNVDAHTHAKITTGLNENKFGIAIEDLLSCIESAQAMANVRYCGLHFHIGSQILDLEVYETLCRRVDEIQTMLEAHGISTPTINLGGGLGIDYDTPDANPIPAFNEWIGRIAKHLKVRQGQEVHFEPGRSIVAQCGTLIARTIYVKQGHAKQFVIVDAGFTELIRPAMYGSHHAIQNLSAEERGEQTTATYDVVGPICESSDVFAKGEVLPLTQRGDLIAFRSAGAYGEVMASSYNCRHLRPTIYSDEC